MTTLLVNLEAKTMTEPEYLKLVRIDYVMYYNVLVHNTLHINPPYECNELMIQMKIDNAVYSYRLVRPLNRLQMLRDYAKRDLTRK